MVKKIKQSRARYRTDGGKACIEIQVKSLKQLFDLRDPAPFIEKDIDDDAHDYILAWAIELPSKMPLKIRIHCQEKIESHDPLYLTLGSENALESVFHNYFEYRAEISRMNLHKILKNARFFLLIGFSFLIVCLGGSELIQRVWLEESPWRSIFREGAVITGWVAMWRPLELFLYDWWPSYEKMNLYKKLMKAPVEVRYTK
jgi:hypothetical protein